MLKTKNKKIYFKNKDINLIIGSRNLTNYFVLENKNFINFLNKVKKLKDCGWKIHISSSCDNFYLTLSKILDFLLENNFSFKFISNPEKLFKKQFKSSDFSSSGKFITIYTENDVDLVKTILKLKKITKNLRGPTIFYDYKIKDSDCLYIRYGSFVEKNYIDADNNFVPIFGEINNFFDDRKWIISPKIKNKNIRNLISPPKEWNLLRKFSLLKTFYENTTTTSYLAKSKLTNKVVVIKETKPCLWNYEKKDYQKFREKESQNLRFLNKMRIGPKFIDCFYEHNNLYLIYEYIEGKTFYNFLIENNNFLKTKQNIGNKIDFVKKNYFNIYSNNKNF